MGDHEVVEDAARVIREKRIALAPNVRLLRSTDERFERAVRITAVQARLPHVRYIEEARLRARVAMLGEDAAGYCTGIS
jgi:hypothetical protein